MNDDQKQYVKGLYYDERGGWGYGSLDRLYKKIKTDDRYNISRKQLSDFLKTQEVYTSHISAQIPKHYPSIVVPNVNWGIEFDSAVMPFKSSNRNFPYVVVGIDQYSRKIAAKAVRSLSAIEVNRAVIAILQQLGEGYVMARTDRGVEYVNNLVQSTFRRKKIKHIFGYEPNKAVLAELAIKQLKARIYKVLQKNGTEVWGPHLDDAVFAINNTKSPYLAGYSPAEVNDDVTEKIWFNRIQRQLKKQPRLINYKYNVGDSVRIRYSRGANSFKKNYDEQMGAKVYYIQNREAPGNIPLYKLRDDRNNLVPGRFKSHELQHVIINDDTVWRIERVLGYRNINGVRMAKVRWLDYGPEYDSYIPADQVQDLNVGNNRRGRVQGRNI